MRILLRLLWGHGFILCTKLDSNIIGAALHSYRPCFQKSRALVECPAKTGMSITGWFDNVRERRRLIWWPLHCLYVALAVCTAYMTHYHRHQCFRPGLRNLYIHIYLHFLVILWLNSSRDAENYSSDNAVIVQCLRIQRCPGSQYKVRFSSPPHDITMSLESTSSIVFFVGRLVAFAASTGLPSGYMDSQIS